MQENVYKVVLNYWALHHVCRKNGGDQSSTFGFSVSHAKNLLV